MKRILLTLLWMTSFITAAQAQEGLEIDKAFTRYGNAVGSKMVEMNDAKVRGYKLHRYKSLTYRSQGDDIDKLLKADRKRAKKIREVVEDGRITGGYYMMAPLPSGLQRYVLFNNGSRGRGAIIYIEGNIKPNDILQLFYTRKIIK